jgi:hypothetical protein
MEKIWEVNEDPKDLYMPLDMELVQNINASSLIQ